MKKTLLSLLILFCVSLLANAIPPTATGSNMSFSSLDGKSFSISITPGNGTYRIVVMKEGSPVVGLPVNGKDYTSSNSNFGTAGSEFTAPGEYVVGRSSWSSYSVSNLKPGTIYHIAVFEYNGTGTNTEYLMLPATGSQSTAVAPTVQTASITATATTGNTITLNFPKGNGTGRMIVARKGAPVNFTPAQATGYYSDENFEQGSSRVNVDNYVVYKGAGTSVTVKNLEPNTAYHFAAFEYNGSSQSMYLLPAVTATATTNAGPTIAAKSIGFSYVEGNSFRVGFTIGNGSRRLVIARKEAPVTFVPVNGQAYTANPVFGTGEELAPGEFMVANIAGSSFDMSNLEAGTVYHFRVYEFDIDKAGNTYYLTGTYAEKSGSTATSPTLIGTNLRLASLTGSTASIALTHGSGTYRCVLMKEGAPVDAAPVNFSTYSGKAAFGTGTQLGAGNYFVAFGINGNPFTVTNLKPGKTYHIAIYEYNGNSAPVYSATGATFSFTVPLEPTAAATNFTYPGIEGNTLRLQWVVGNGSRRMIIAKKGSAPSSKPVDGVTYNANINFGQGDAIAPGEFVIYNGDYYYEDFKNFEIASTYHFALYEYNVDENGNPDYLTTAFLTGSTSTSAWPTVQATLASATNIQATQATVHFGKGNGKGRILIMKEGSPVDVVPQDLKAYTYNTGFGEAAARMGNGNYVIYTGDQGGNFTVTRLKPLTTYYIKAFEFNGSRAPAYLVASPAATSFTTIDMPGATVPTVAATAGKTSKVDGNKLTFGWTAGNGEKRLVVMRKGSPVSFEPLSATSYTANAAFGNGIDLGGGQYIVYNSSGNSVDITNLEPATVYHFAVYEFNGAGDLIRYLTTSKLEASGSTSMPPAVVASNVNSVVGDGTLTLNWTAGDGSGRLVVMKEGSAPTAKPVNLSAYPANAIFRNGSQMAAGEYVVFAGAGNSVTITGLENSTYHFAIYEYNGSAAPVYNLANVVAGSATISSTLPVQLGAFTAKEAGSNVVVRWTTLQEANSSHFVIERSLDGSSFYAIATVAAAGNSSVRKDYSYNDLVSAIEGKIYYRLKQVDKDGRVDYSAVQLVEKKQVTGISIYPNPVVSGFRLSMPKGVREAQLLVYGTAGNQVLNRKVKEGEVVEATALTAGTYLLVLEYNGQKTQLKMVKL